MTYSKDEFKWLNEASRLFLSRGYVDGDPIERIKFIADKAEERLGEDFKGFSKKFFKYMSRGWYSLSSPIWSNFGLDRGLPISCFGSYYEDSMDSLAGGVAENMMMSKVGGGTSGYFGALRPRGTPITNNGKSDGSYSFAKMWDKAIDVVSQGTSRKGQFAGYIDIEHGDIEEWLDIHSPGNAIQLMLWGVTVGSQWLQEMRDGDIAKRKIWARVLQSRNDHGIPYIMYKDNANKNTVDVYKDKKMTIYASNLCTEIMLPSNAKESFVCCLSSMNLELYDEWKDTDAVETLVYFLDAVMSEFIDKAKHIPFLEKACRFAERHRALGLGVLGWHSLLQSKMIPFDSYDASRLNAEIFKTLNERAYKASGILATKLGECAVTKGYGRRNTTLLAIAPTKSSSFILGQVSQGIEPIQSNYFVKDLAKIEDTFKNPELIKLLESKNKNTAEVWSSILINNGSVQHLDFLSEHEKNVFKTFSEVSQLSVIQQAAQRQRFIDQGQSVNIMIHPKTPTKDVNNLILEAHDLGLKSLYYQKSFSASQELNRDLLSCSSCQG